MTALALTTRFRRASLVAFALGVFAGAPAAPVASAASSARVRGPVKVFILAGQSNMEGKALASTLDAVIDDPATHDEFAHLKPNGDWAVRNDVWVTFLDKTVRGDDGGIPRFGPLTVGFGGQKQVRQPDGRRVTAPTLGPELGFGWMLGDRLTEPVLLIKAAWGGKSVRRDFRPPGAPPDEAELAEALARARKKNPTLTMAELRTSYGRYYRKILEEVRKVLADLERYCPAYDSKQGYELAGLVWFQGWNDGVGAGNPDYAVQLAQMIRDLRRDLGAPDLPVVIGELGVDGPEAGGWIARFRAQQEAVAARPEFRDSVRLARTAAFWPTQPDLNDEWKAFQAAARANTAKPDDDPTKVTPRESYEQNWVARYRRELAYTSDKRYHYKGSGACYYRMGRAMGEAMCELLDQ